MLYTNGTDQANSFPEDIHTKHKYNHYILPHLLEEV